MNHPYNSKKIIKWRKNGMKICFIADANSYHIQKWCSWFSKHGHEVHIISFFDKKIDNVVVHSLNSSVDVNGNNLSKIKYLLNAVSIKQIVNKIQPDVINVHYATSYGATVALSGIKGYVLSVWGSDVYDFPNEGFINKLMVKLSLSRADYLFSTSKVMAKETKKYTKKPIVITPFGVDMDLFSPDKRKRTIDDNRYIVGMVKSLKPKYGIDYLLKAIQILKQQHPDIPLEVRIAGEGPCEKEYHQLAEKLGISNIVHWLGFISQEDAAREWANMDVAIIPSIQDSESFGVAAVEAEACGIPVVISDIPGLMEATMPEETSIVIKRCDEQAICEALYELYTMPQKRKSMGNKGRQFVSSQYEINSCFEKVEKEFIEISRKTRNSKK